MSLPPQPSSATVRRAHASEVVFDVVMFESPFDLSCMPSPISCDDTIATDSSHWFSKKGGPLFEGGRDRLGGGHEGLAGCKPQTNPTGPAGAHARKRSRFLWSLP
jgi:hypothetical protein